MNPGHGTTGIFLMGHGSVSDKGVGQFSELAKLVEVEAPDGVLTGHGFIELAEPGLDDGIAQLVASGAKRVVVVPMVLLAAGHMKNDGPAAIERARRRFPETEFLYARDLSIHPTVLSLISARCLDATTVLGGSDSLGPLKSPMDSRSEVGEESKGVMIVGRGSTDPDANSDLLKIARLLQEFRVAPLVEASFVSLAPPGVADGLKRCAALGAKEVSVVPYFLFDGILVDRIYDESTQWSASNAGVQVNLCRPIGPDPALVPLIMERFEEALEGTKAPMSCDLCVYRSPLPGHEHKVGKSPQQVSPHAHEHGHGHHRH